MAVGRRFNALEASPSKGVALAAEMVGPVLHLFHLKFDCHGVLVFRRLTAGSWTGASSNRFVVFVSVPSSFLITSAILLDFGSTSTRTISRPLPLAALIQRA